MAKATAVPPAPVIVPELTTVMDASVPDADIVNPFAATAFAPDPSPAMP